MIRITPKILTQIEQCFANAGYKIRYEKGNFQSGYCLITGQKTIIINQFINTEGRAYCLVEILKQNLDILDVQDDQENQKLLTKLLIPEKEKITKETKELDKKIENNLFENKQS